MLLTIVVPSFKSSETIGTLLSSVYLPLEKARARGLSVDAEVLVVDEKSPDQQKTAGIIQSWPKAQLIKQEGVRGVAAARNIGFRASKGDFAGLVDADDEMVPEWPERFLQLVESWPSWANVTLSECVNFEGKPTVMEPGYQGAMTLADRLNERHAGEYMPLFRGEYIRRTLYTDTGMRRECGCLSYLRFLKDGPFRVSSLVLRRYNDPTGGSVANSMSNWSDDFIQEMRRCAELELQEFGTDYKALAPQVYRTRKLRQAVYTKLSGSPGAWELWLEGLSASSAKESAAALAMMVLGKEKASQLVSFAKRSGLRKRYS